MKRKQNSYWLLFIFRQEMEDKKLEPKEGEAVPTPLL